jgi:hypothetical protein
LGGGFASGMERLDVQASLAYLRCGLPQPQNQEAHSPGRLWASFLPSLLRLRGLLGRPKIRFGPEQSGLRVSERSRPPAREACVARDDRRLQPTFAGEYRRSATFPDRRGMAHLRVLVIDGRCTGSFGGRSLAEALRLAAHSRIVIVRAAWPLHLPVLGCLQLRGSRINLAVSASLLASEAPQTLIAAS